jgi:hypothetical protein
LTENPKKYGPHFSQSTVSEAGSRFRSISIETLLSSKSERRLKAPLSASWWGVLPVRSLLFGLSIVLDNAHGIPLGQNSV